jgi:PST family polysaccharide transporter
MITPIKFKKLTHQAKNGMSRNKKVAENYFYLTVLQILNSFFYLLIYPFLIRRLGADSYGLYVFALSITSYSGVLVNFGFSNPGVREISIHRNDKNQLSFILSSILTAQMYIFVIVTLISTALIFLIPFLREHYILYIVSSFTVLSSILFPTWFFQGIEKMGFITILQVGSKILSLPFIFVFVQGKEDFVKLAVINTSSTIIGAVFALFIIVNRMNIRVKRQTLRNAYSFVKDALPFFWGSAASIVKMQSTSFFTGTFISMSDVAMYDLANKLVMAPTMILANINNALFPKMAKTKDGAFAKKAIWMQTILGFSCIIVFLLLGKWIIQILGGSQMQRAFPILLTLSFIVPGWLIVGAIQLFVIIPLKKYYYITISQVLAFIVYMALTIVGAVVYKNILWVAGAMSISALAELIYNLYIVKKKTLMLSLNKTI